MVSPYKKQLWLMLFSAKKFNGAEKTRFVSLALVLIYFWQKIKELFQSPSKATKTTNTKKCTTYEKPGVATNFQILTWLQCLLQGILKLFTAPISGLLMYSNNPKNNKFVNDNLSIVEVKFQ